MAPAQQQQEQQEVEEAPGPFPIEQLQASPVHPAAVSTVISKIGPCQDMVRVLFCRNLGFLLLI